jgi:hypothetical protein
VNRVGVERGQHVPTKGLDRLDRDVALHRRGQQSEHDLVDTRVGVFSDRDLDLLRRAVRRVAGRDRSVDLVGGRIG